MAKDRARPLDMTRLAAQAMESSKRIVKSRDDHDARQAKRAEQAHREARESGGGPKPGKPVQRG